MHIKITGSENYWSSKHLNYCVEEIMYRTIENGLSKPVGSGHGR